MAELFGDMSGWLGRLGSDGLRVFMARGADAPLCVPQTLQVAPEDPSCWSYYRWLLAMVAEHARAGDPATPRGVTTSAACQVLVAEEARCLDIAGAEQARLNESRAPGGAPVSSASLAMAVTWPLQVAAEVSALLRSTLPGAVRRCRPCPRWTPSVQWLPSHFVGHSREIWPCRSLCLWWFAAV